MRKKHTYSVHETRNISDDDRVGKSSSTRDPPRVVAAQREPTLGVTSSCDYFSPRGPRLKTGPLSAENGIREYNQYNYTHLSKWILSL